VIGKIGSRAICLISLGMLVFAAGCSGISLAPAVDESVPTALVAYSQDLSSGTISRDSLYAPEMKALLQERREFYDEFFFNALHSDLTSITSTYDIRSISEDPEHKDRFVVRAGELLEFKAKYRLEPGGHPIVKAAAWAIEHTDDPAVKMELQNLASMHNTSAIWNSTEGYDTAFVLEHTLLIVRKWDGLQILQDAYTDVNPQDNPGGTDVIEWQDGAFSRKQVDYSAYPDYSMYQTSIEELGQSLLNDYSK